MLIGLLAALAVTPAGVAADCSPSGTDASRAACLRAGLEAADQSINTTYQALRQRLGAPGALPLRDEQRAWIRRRDQVCGLETAKGDRAAWMASLAVDYGKTVCVVRFTTERQAELEHRLALVEGRAAPQPVAPQSAAPQPAAARPVAPSPAPPPAPPQVAPPPAPPGEAVYDLRAHGFNATGKRYFEVALDIGRLAALNDQAIFVGIKSRAGQSIGTLLTVRRSQTNAPARNVGIAVDLDAGKLYVRVNGAWPGGAPGSSGGQDVKLGQPYIGWFSSSTALDAALQSRAVQANFGQQAFVYALPDGYTPMDPAGAIPVRDTAAR